VAVVLLVGVVERVGDGVGVVLGIGVRLGAVVRVEVGVARGGCGLNAVEVAVDKNLVAVDVGRDVNVG
jgi:hypothetical protein